MNLILASITNHLHLLQLYEFIQPKGPITLVFVCFALHLKQRCSSNSFNCSSVKFKIQSPKEKQSPLILLCTRPHFCLPAIKLTMLTLLLIGLVVFLFYQTWSHHISHNKAVYNIILVLKISKYKSIII